MVEQITVFLENKEGHLADLARAVASAGANMTALSVADTSAYGLVRILCSDVPAARRALEEQGFSAAVTKVVAVRMGNEPGALAALLDAVEGADINVEYAYCFTQGNGALGVLKVRNANAAVAALEAAGFAALEQADL